MPEKTYLGDSVYAEYDNYHIVLTTNNGGKDSNRIALNFEVYAALVKFKLLLHTDTKS